VSEWANFRYPVEMPSPNNYGNAMFEVLLYEFKAGLNAYLASLGPSAPVKTLAEVIAFNEANKDKVMPYFGQERWCGDTSTAERCSRCRNKAAIPPSMESHIMKMKHSSAVLLSVALLVGCGENPPDTDACEHLQEGPASAITASANETGAPLVNNDHRRYDLSLIDGAGGKGGSVSFAVTEANDYTLFLTEIVPVNLKDANGQRIEVVASGTNSFECSEVERRHMFALPVGTYTLTFGPTMVGSLSLVIVGAEHED